MEDTQLSFNEYQDKILNTIFPDGNPYTIPSAADKWLDRFIADVKAGRVDPSYKDYIKYNSSLGESLTFMTNKDMKFVLDWDAIFDEAPSTLVPEKERIYPPVTWLDPDKKVMLDVNAYYEQLFDPNTQAKYIKERMMESYPARYIGSRATYLSAKILDGLTLGIGRWFAGNYPEKLAKLYELPPEAPQSIEAGEPFKFALTKGDKIAADFFGTAASLYTIGKLLKPLVSKLPARELGRKIAASTATFAIQNVAEQTADYIGEGERPSLPEFMFNTGIGLLSGAIDTGLTKLFRKASLHRALTLKPSSQLEAESQAILREMVKIDKSAVLRGAEAMEAYADNMPKSTLLKVYGEDLYRLSQVIIQAANNAFGKLRLASGIADTANSAIVKSLFTNERYYAAYIKAHRPAAKPSGTPIVTPQVIRVGPVPPTAIVEVKKPVSMAYYVSSDTLESGDYGTGVYVLSTPEKALRVKGATQPVQAIDLSNYYLFKPANENQANELRDAFKQLSKALSGRDQRKYADDFATMLEAARSGHKSGYKSTALYRAANRIYKALDNPIDKDRYLDKVVEAVKASADSKKSASTLLMESLGYDGIDNSNIAALRDTKYGTVIYDINAIKGVPSDAVVERFADLAMRSVGVSDVFDGELMRDTVIYPPVVDQLAKLSIKTKDGRIFTEYATDFEQLAVRYGLSSDDIIERNFVNPNGTVISTTLPILRPGDVVGLNVVGKLNAPVKIEKISDSYITFSRFDIDSAKFRLRPDNFYDRLVTSPIRLETGSQYRVLLPSRKKDVIATVLDITTDELNPVRSQVVFSYETKSGVKIDQDSVERFSSFIVSSDRPILKDIAKTKAYSIEPTVGTLKELPAPPPVERPALPPADPPGDLALVPRQPSSITKTQRVRGKRPGPSVGPIITPSTQIMLHPDIKFLEEYSRLRSQLLGNSPVPIHPEIKKARLKSLDELLRARQRFENRYATKLATREKEPDILNKFTCSDHMMMSLGENLGLPLWPLWEDMQRKSGLATKDILKEVLGDISDVDVASLTPDENYQIASYLFSPQTRLAVEGNMSEKTIAIARQLHSVLQGPAALDIQEMEAYRWMREGIPPANVSEYKNPREILARLRQADKAGGREYVRRVLEDYPGIGVRKFYYMSDPEQYDMIDEYLRTMGLNVLDAPASDAPLPGSFTYESLPRRSSHTQLRKGSVINNVISHVARVRTANYIREPLEKLNHLLSGSLISDPDKRVLANMINNLLMRRTPLEFPFNFLTGMEKLFWRENLSLVWNPQSALSKSFRNSFQAVAFSPAMTNASSIGKEFLSFRLALARGKTIEEIDPFLAKYMDEMWESVISQRLAKYKEYLLREASSISKDYRNLSLARKAIWIMEKTGGLYGAVDEYVCRMPLFTGQYFRVKKLATEFTNGKITYDKFAKATNLYQFRTEQQMLIQDLLDAHMPEQAAAKMAEWTTWSVNFKYRTPERSGIEQTPAQRALVGLYTFPRGYFELAYFNCVKPFVDGFSSGDYVKAWMGAKGLLKLLMSSSITGAFLGYTTGRRFYGVLQNSTYSALDPATGTVVNTLEYIGRQVSYYSDGRQSLSETASNVLTHIGEIGETWTLPLVDLALDYYESKNDIAGVSVSKMVRNGILKAFGYKPKEYTKAVRTGREKLLHILWGSYEYVESQPDTGGLKLEEAKKLEVVQH